MLLLLKKYLIILVVLLLLFSILSLVYQSFFLVSFSTNGVILTENLSDGYDVTFVHDNRIYSGSTEGASSEDLSELFFALTGEKDDEEFIEYVTTNLATSYE